MKKFIGAMIFGVIVVILMVTQWTRQQQAEQAHTPTNFRASLDGQMRSADHESAVNHVAADGRSLDSYQIVTVEGALAQDIALDTVAYRLQYEPVDHQWFREMEQALYNISYNTLEPDGVRMVNLECVTSVCIADFELSDGAELSVNAFLQASRSIDTFHHEALSMVFLAPQNGLVERIIFQRKE